MNRSLKTTIFSAVLAGALALLTAAAQAAVPELISFQGKLADSAGRAITTSVQMTFKLYTAASGSALPVWTENQTVTPDEYGIYSVLLGDVAALNVSFSTAYYLGVKVGTDLEMTPRYKLVSSAYSLYSVNSGTAAWASGADWATITNKPALTAQGNTFNGISQLVLLGTDGRLPALDGSLLSNVSASGIANGAVTLAKMADMAAGSLIYRKTAGAGAPEVNTLATLKADLGLTGTNSGDIAAGAAGNLMISNGTTWASAAVPTWNQSTTGNAATATNLTGLTATVANLNSVTGTLGTAAYTADTAYATAAQGAKADAALPSASFTDAAVTGKVITGYASGAGVIAETDTILGAINKLSGNITANGNGTVTGVTGTAPVASSGGTAPVISMAAATNANAGYATAAQIAAIEANTLKITNATHTGEVTGSGALTIANGAVTDAKVTLSTGAITGGKFGDDRVAISTQAVSGGVYNAAGKLVQLTSDNKLPALDGSALINVTAGDVYKANSQTFAGQNTFTSQVIISSDITAARYQINGSTVVAQKGYGGLQLGVGAGPSTTGNYNTFVGNQSGTNNIAGFMNTFTGASSGLGNTTGNYNTFLGAYAGQTNAAGADNVYVGKDSGKANTLGSNNSYLGSQSGYNSRGSENAVLGYKAGFGASNQSFSSATLVGSQAGLALTTGSDNIMLGYKAGYTVTSGTGNIIIGYEKTTPLATTNNFLNIGGVLFGDLTIGGLTSGNVGIGTSSPGAKLDVAGGDINTSDTYQLGGQTVLSVRFGQTLALGFNNGPTDDNDSGPNTYVGVNAGRINYEGGHNTYMGYGAGYSNVNGSDNSFIGDTAGYANTGSGNTFMGKGAGYSNGSAGNNIYIGDSAGYNSSDGSLNVYIGNNAGAGGTGATPGGSQNTYVGYDAGNKNTLGSENVFMGSSAGTWNATGSQNTAVGMSAGMDNVTGSANAILGYKAGNGDGSTSSYSSSTLVGYQAGAGLSTGSDNILLGWNAGYDITTGHDNIVIGYNKTTSGVAANNELNIGGVYKGNIVAGTGAGTATIPRYTVADKGTNPGAITLVDSDFGKTFTSTGTSTGGNYYLPAVDATDIGAQFTFVKLGSGTLTIWANGSASIADSPAGGIISNALETYATITLRLTTDLTWSIMGGNGSWTTGPGVF